MVDVCGDPDRGDAGGPRTGDLVPAGEPAPHGARIHVAFVDGQDEGRRRTRRGRGRRSAVLGRRGCRDSAHGRHRRVRDLHGPGAGERGPHRPGLLRRPAGPRRACRPAGRHDVRRPRPGGAARLAVAGIPGAAGSRDAGAALGRSAGFRRVAPPHGPRRGRPGRAAEGAAGGIPSPASAGTRADVGPPRPTRRTGCGGRPRRAPGSRRHRAALRVRAPGLRADGPRTRRRRRLPPHGARGRQGRSRAGRAVRRPRRRGARRLRRARPSRARLATDRYRAVPRGARWAAGFARRLRPRGLPARRHPRIGAAGASRPPAHGGDAPA